MNTVIGILTETWLLLLEMAPYLLFGFLVAGLLNLVLPRNRVSKHLAGHSAGASIKAALLGVPLPLCSCGVIPVAAHLEKQGASKGSILSFLISTPTTGVDSALATYSLLGPLLAVVRPVAALVSGVATGLLFSLSEDKTTVQPSAEPEDTAAALPQSLFARLRSAVDYGFTDLVRDTAVWLVIGLFAGGIISYVISATTAGNLAGAWLANPWISYPLMLLIGIPMYVCATGSIPIVASLILHGMSPGAGFVFLFAGPATNTATLSFVGGKLGRSALLFYLTSIAFWGLAFGLLIDVIWMLSGNSMALLGHQHELLPLWLKQASALLLILLVLRGLWPIHSEALTEAALEIDVPDMNCEHCKKTISCALEELEGITAVSVDLDKRQVQVAGEILRVTVLQAISRAGYHPE